MSSELATVGSAPTDATETVSHPSSASMAQTLAWRLVVAVAVAFIAVYVGLAVLRIRYPFALEWIEGGMLDEVRWILAGHAPYVAPSVDYVPFIYNPLYFWVSAVFAKALGLSFFALRLVSFLSSLGSLWLLARLVWLETRDRGAAVVASGLFASTFKTTEQFMDIARVDSLYLFFGLLAFFLLRTRQGLGGRLAAGACLAACFLTKQSGAFIAAPLVAWVALSDLRAARSTAARWQAAVLPAVTVAGIGGSVWLLDRWTDGWYTFFAFTVPSEHRLVPGLWGDFWRVDLAGFLPVACVGAVFVLVVPGAVAARARGLWAAALAGVLLASWSGRLHDGGWRNVIMPAFAVLSALFALALHRARVLCAAMAEASLRARVGAFVLACAAGQFAMNLYDPRPMLPKDGDEAEGRSVVALLASAPGDVFAPTDSYLAPMAGKAPHLHQMAVDDLIRAAPCATTENLKHEIKDALSHHRWAMVVTDNDWFAADVVANYARGKRVVPDNGSFTPVAGVPYRPGFAFTPKAPSSIDPAR